MNDKHYWGLIVRMSFLIEHVIDIIAVIVVLLLLFRRFVFTVLLSLLTAPITTDRPKRTVFSPNHSRKDARRVQTPAKDDVTAWE